MSRSTGLAIFPANFEPRLGAPLDARGVVELRADLTNSATWDTGDGNAYVYRGMLVTVAHDIEDYNGLYVLQGENYQSLGHWQKIGDAPPPPEYKSYMAAAPVRAHHVVVGQVDGKARELGIDTPGHGLSILGIARTAADTGVTFSVQSSGYMTEAGWSWAPNEPIYAGAEGLLTQSIPAGSFIVIVALALSATEINVFLQTPIYL